MPRFAETASSTYGGNVEEKNASLNFRVRSRNDAYSLST